MVVTLVETLTMGLHMVQNDHFSREVYELLPDYFNEHTYISKSDPINPFRSSSYLPSSYLQLLLILFIRLFEYTIGIIDKLLLPEVKVIYDY